MPRRELTLARDAASIERIIRVLGRSVNVAILSELLAARRDRESGGWVGLSDLAKRVDEAPGTVSVAVQRLLPMLVEEKYEKGRRYFRARMTGLSLVVEDAPPGFP